MNKKSSSFDNDILIADILIRVKSIENLLIAKGIFTLDELLSETKAMADKVAKTILQNANVPGDLDEIITNAHYSKKDN
jgi:hypothetical protein